MGQLRVGSGTPERSATTTEGALNPDDTVPLSMIIFARQHFKMRFAPAASHATTPPYCLHRPTPLHIAYKHLLIVGPRRSTISVDRVLQVVKVDLALLHGVSFYRVLQQEAVESRSQASQGQKGITWFRGVWHERATNMLHCISAIFPPPDLLDKYVPRYAFAMHSCGELDSSFPFTGNSSVSSWPELATMYTFAS